jgi:dinuclear metal center YbgI/SA1388 family protein
MLNTELDAILAEIYTPNRFKDHCPNGLCVEGKQKLRKGITGVSLTLDLIHEAIRLQADFIIVHHPHGFWQNQSPVLKGPQRKKVALLLEHNINVWGFHLPMDAHPELGNNAVLARGLGIEITGTWLPAGSDIAVLGKTPSPMPIESFRRIVEGVVGPTIHLEGGPSLIQNIALCTGAAPNEIDSLGARGGIDVFITGEARETTAAAAKEWGLHFIGAGHHNTEVFGPKAIANYLNTHHPLEVQFVDIPNPI